MIKLERGKRPKELTQEVCDELTKMYVENRDKDVWNCSKVKQPLKDALLGMTCGKCAYCECQLDIESKDVTIDHFLPKSNYPNMVLQWENLLPSCLRCNRDKNDYSEKIVDPCIDNPQEYLALNKKNRYRLEGLDRDGVGKNTLISIKLNDIARVMVPRMRMQRLRQVICLMMIVIYRSDDICKTKINGLIGSKNWKMNYKKLRCNLSDYRYKSEYVT